MSRRACLTRISVLTLMAVWLSVGIRPAWGLNPESPQVKAMVDKACKYLSDHKYVAGKSEWAMGGQSLIALALYKSDKEKYHDHPKVLQALKTCQGGGGGGGGVDIYGTAIATIFLCEYDPDGNRERIEAFLATLISRQSKHGGWCYANRTIGDTSQTQYGVLSLWTAQAKGFNVPVANLEKATEWLIKTQDVSGGWGYQAILPSGNGRVQQNGITNSLVAAACGSLYILGDAMKLEGHSKKRAPQVKGSVREVVDPKAAKTNSRALSQKVNIGALKKSIDDGNNWFATKYRLPQAKWNYYYLYAIERYMSFKEKAESFTDDNPGWYNNGVAYLAKQQQKDGHFKESAEEGGEIIGTAFAILFLVRSTQKSLIEDSGLQVGGYSLPDDLSSLRLGSDGKIEKSETEVSLDVLLDEIRKGNNAILDKVAVIPEELLSRDAQGLLVKRRLSDPDYEKRLQAVISFAKPEKLEFAPHLLYALTDGDSRVVRVARDGLRKLSRKINGYGLPNTPSETQKSAAQARWRQWYLSIQPDAKLFD